MFDLLLVVIPVFLVVGAGYLAARAKIISPAQVDGLMVFTQSFAIPCLLFRATMSLDLAAVFDWRLLGSFYLGSSIAFALGIAGARLIFRRTPGESVVIGFGALFSNSVLLGLPIMERAYGAEALAPNYAIVALHAPFCYAVGITVMELARADGQSAAATARVVGRTIFRNGLMIGIALGFAANLTGLVLPTPVMAALDIMVPAALPAALFGMGGVLTRYAIRASLGEAAMTSALSLIVHPAIAYVMCVYVFALPIEFTRAAVVTAAMAPGVNTYIFASLYDRAKGAAASTMLLATGASVISVSLWLAILARLA